MGDRGNIVVITEPSANGRPPEQVWLYTHCGGSEIAATLRLGMNRAKDRWDDPPYFARNVFAEMVKGQEQETIGFGVSTGICDNEHSILVADCSTKTVYTIEQEELKNGKIPNHYRPKKAKTFEEFANGK